MIWFRTNMALPGNGGICRLYQILPQVASLHSRTCGLLGATATAWRWNSSDSGGQGSAAPALNLKSALKSLYLKVHPDLFSEWPAEQAENLRSFQLLQEYLEQARRPSNGSPAFRTPFRFQFFLKPQPQQFYDGLGTYGSENDAAASTPSSSGATLGRVELTLPPPEPSPAGGEVLSAATKKALGKLLGMCGLMVDVTAESQEELAAKRRLLNFLPEAVERVRQSESGDVGWEVRAANMRGAMRLARQVVVGFGPGNFPGPRQIELLQALARVLDELAGEGVEVTGAHIMFGSRTTMDSKGTLWLDAFEDDHEAWADFIGGADLSFAAAKREAAEKLRALEAAVAQAAGLGMIFAPGGLTMTQEYRVFLERLAKHAATHGPIRPSASQSTTSSTSSGSNAGSKTSRNGSSNRMREQQRTASFGDLPVYVCPSTPYANPEGGDSSSSSDSGGGTSGSGAGRPGFEVREGMGCVQVPVAAQAYEVYGFVQDRGQEALRLLADRQKQEARLEDLTSRVRRRLRLRRLMRDPLVSPWQFEAACGRLLQHAQELMQFMEGLSVRVSDGNRVEGQVVDVAWDAEL